MYQNIVDVATFGSSFSKFKDGAGLCAVLGIHIEDGGFNTCANNKIILILFPCNKTIRAFPNRHEMLSSRCPPP